MTDQQSSGSGVWKWILGALAVLFVVVIAGGWFAWRKFSGGMQENIQAIAVVQDKIGTIRTLRLNAEAIAKVGRPGVVVFDLSGSAGDGQLTLELDTASTSRRLIMGGSLVLKDGSKWPVVMDEPDEPVGPAPAVPAAPAAPAAPADSARAAAPSTPAPKKP